MKAREQTGRALVVGVVVLVLLAAAGGVAYWLLRPPGPDAITDRFLRAWKANDTTAMAAVSTPEKSPGGSNDHMDLLALAKDARFNHLRATGPASVSEDIATAPAEANLNGRATARAVGKAVLGAEPNADAEKEMAFALNRSFSFTVGLVRQDGRWRVDQKTTMLSLVDALRQDADVRRAAVSLLVSSGASGPLGQSLGESIRALGNALGSAVTSGLETAARKTHHH